MGTGPERADLEPALASGVVLFLVPLRSRTAALGTTLRPGSPELGYLGVATDCSESGHMCHRDMARSAQMAFARRC